ncbi:MAG TPA: hypothetical protein VN157_09130 [Caulobacter sp.]|jgi:hypothetical protein|uniref:hypothetical protein n=1 Tax=unclassified Caulobacter TaxID=2648921 RepID=UPI000D72E1E1|nr:MULTISPECIES: hypothetical protein [unclassified Caulobacter]PXA85005.1 hypothetical protein DMC25_16300 [Caulobacter sp. D4A]PXA93476.1 hypothetical protein DMC18_08730 [Caulobacter sp. D5]HWU14158.1 hypothetical protein [Caulobacter sp.]
MSTRSPEPTVAEVLAWMRERPPFSWADTIRDIEYAVSEIKDEARRTRRRTRAAARLASR